MQECDSVCHKKQGDSTINLITLLLCASLTRPCIDNVQFSVYEQDSPNKVVFLMGGTGTDSDYWFDDLNLFENHKDILFVGVAQSCRLKDDLEIIIDWVNENYEIPRRDNWSFFGFSLGAYQIYSIAMKNYHNVFGNYCAVGGGADAGLEEDPDICFLYVCYGSGDMDKSSAEFAIKKLEENGYLNQHNFKREILQGECHSLAEAKKGLSNFLYEIDRVEVVNKNIWKMIHQKGVIKWVAKGRERNDKRRSNKQGYCVS